ncbi:MAG: methionyl-tRNA formyltransferase [Candidatus Latescibacteria bacterium]|nr:methionyl-tRNA formyltransferase [Candidatus Latescibacterota bacterium]MDP7239330.1 methionyl-tRNA formyltransferase [Candidatus Latescibacterota bacterium]
MRLVFMGTPDFAVSSLRRLIQHPDHEVVGVVTQPDRPKGRGLKIVSSPVKQITNEYGLPVLQPERLRDPLFKEDLANFLADMFVVVAFRMLPVSILMMPPKGSINLHASLLPAYRGAAPIHWAIMNGELETGVTTFLIDRHMDTGDILCQKKIPVGPDETTGSLHDRLAIIGAGVLTETIDFIAAGQARPQPQSGASSGAPKLSRADARINWSQMAQTIHNRIRGLNPFPMAYTTWHDRTIRLIQSQLTDQSEVESGMPGEIIAADKHDGIVVQTGEGHLKLVTVQPEGRKRISTAEFVRGYRVKPGDRFGVEHTPASVEAT